MTRPRPATSPKPGNLIWTSLLSGLLLLVAASCSSGPSVPSPDLKLEYELHARCEQAVRKKLQRPAAVAGRASRDGVRWDRERFGDPKHTVISVHLSSERKRFVKISGAFTVQETPLRSARPSRRLRLKFRCRFDKDGRRWTLRSLRLYLGDRLLGPADK